MKVSLKKDVIYYRDKIYDIDKINKNINNISSSKKSSI
jgi:hypothetical protein